MGVLNTVQLLEGIQFILVRWLGGDRVKVFGQKRRGRKKNRAASELTLGGNLWHYRAWSGGSKDSCLRMELWGKEYFLKSSGDRFCQKA